MSTRILVISDSHGKNDDVKAVIEQVNKTGKIDMLIHLGDVERGPDYIKSLVDCPVHMISGNNDYNVHLPADEIIEVEGYKIFITHGHRFYVGGGVGRLRALAEENGFDVVMFGHTHMPFLEIGDKVTILNPGSISYPRQEGRKQTFLMMEIDDKKQVHYGHGYLRSSFKDLYAGY